jgi:molybdopterin molybdotransferase
MPGRSRYVRASLGQDGGTPCATKFPRDGAGILSSITRSDGLVILDEALTELAPGMMVDFLPFEAVLA